MPTFPFFSPARIRDELSARGAAPRKRHGQSFLTDAAQARRIADAVLADGEDPVLEIGPGPGAITHQLLEAGREVFAVELDPVLADVLEETLRESYAGAAFHLQRGDALKFLAELRDADATCGDAVLERRRLRLVCGNLPYYISTDLLTACSELEFVRRGVFLTQREFADRVTAERSDSSLNVYLGNFGTWQDLGVIGPNAFFPRPRVSSTILEYRRHNDGPRCRAAVLEKVLRMSFAARRKKLANSWKQDRRGYLDPEQLHVAARTVGVDPDRRAEEISREAYYELARSLEANGAT